MGARRIEFRERGKLVNRSGFRLFADFISYVCVYLTECVCEMFVFFLVSVVFAFYGCVLSVREKIGVANT